MKLILLMPLAFLVTTPGQFPVHSLPGSAGAMWRVASRDYTTASSAAPEALWGEWGKLKGNIECKELTFYSGGGLDIRTEKKTLSAYYEIKEGTTKFISGQILAWRPAGNSPARPFTITFLSPSKIELTLLYKDRRSRKAILQKQRDFHAGAWLID